MKKKWLVLAAVAVLASVVSASAAGEVTGTVKGPDGAALRAVWVKAEHADSKRTANVLSNAQGRYQIDNLPAGNYNIWATSPGWRGARMTGIAVADGKPFTADFAMKPTPVLWHEITKAQAITLLPEAPGKERFLTACMNCHGMNKIIGRRDQQGWLDAIDTMRRVGVTTIQPPVANEVAGYLATVLGPDSATPQSPTQMPGWKDVQMTFTDEALNIVYVDYPVKSGPGGRPGTGEMDEDGMVWMEIDGGLSRLNPDTGEIKVYRMPDDNGGNGEGIHEVLPRGDDIWLTATGANALVKFNKKTEAFEVYKDPTPGQRVKQIDPNTPTAFPRVSAGEGSLGRKHTAVMDKNGNLWMTGRPLTMYNPKTKEWKAFSAEVQDTYGIDVDPDGNVWFAEFNSAENYSVGMVDAKTGKVSKFKPPSGNIGRPRRLHTDSKGNVWFAQYFNGSIAKLDRKSGQITEIKLPGPHPTVYGFGVDKNDNVWGVSHFNEVRFRIDPAGKVTVFPSPYIVSGTRDLKVDKHNRMWEGIQSEYKIGYFYVRSPTATSSQQQQ